MRSSLGVSIIDIGHEGPIAGLVLIGRNVVLKVGRRAVASGGPWRIRSWLLIGRRCKPKRPNRSIGGEGR